MCTLQRAQFQCNLHEILPEYLSHLHLGQDQNWLMSGQKLGHKVKSYKKKHEKVKRHSFDLHETMSKCLSECLSP